MPIFLRARYMVTVANVVGYAGIIALAKPYLSDKITNELLNVENISLTPHLTEESKRVITESTIKSFNIFFDQIEQKDKVISFVACHLSSSRRTLRKEAENFLSARAI